MVGAIEEGGWMALRSYTISLVRLWDFSRVLEPEKVQVLFLVNWVVLFLTQFWITFVSLLKYNIHKVHKPKHTTFKCSSMLTPV